MLKPLTAILLLPLTYALLRLFGDLTGIAWGDLTSRDLIWWTIYGVAFWTALFFIFRPPISFYVIGHELSHALFAWMQGVKVLSFKIHAGGGQIEVERTNWLITLAPYFFPIYSLIILLAYLVVTEVAEIEGLTRFWMLMLGISWAFHITFTGQMLTMRQSDIEREGWFFAGTVIILFNLLVVVCWAICVANPDWSTVAERFWTHLTGWLRPLFAGRH